jgi:CTP synthase (UTP-ammonia lyase)
MKEQLRVGIIGDYDPNLRFHRATNESLDHAAAALSVSVQPTWLPTQSLASDSVEATLAAYNAFWCSPGSPYKSMDGALRAIRFAREQRRPFIGT